MIERNPLYKKKLYFFYNKIGSVPIVLSVYCLPPASVWHPDWRRAEAVRTNCRRIRKEIRNTQARHLGNPNEISLQEF